MILPRFCNVRPILILCFGILLGISFALLFCSINEDRNMNIDKNKIQQHFIGEVHQADDSHLANYLHNEVKVLCWILTSPKNHYTKAIHVKKTWGRRCNKLLIMSSQQDDELGTIGLNVPEGASVLWLKTKAALKYIYDHYLDEFDWFYKADDDTYTIVENLRYLLYAYNKTYPIYFGFKLKMRLNGNSSTDVYMSGGAGYVLSQESVRRFVEKALPNTKQCPVAAGAEDAALGKCLQSVNVIPGDSRDALGRGRFFVFSTRTHLFPYQNKTFWYWNKMYYKSKDGFAGMSDNAISFHYIHPQELHLMDYLIYHIRPYAQVFSHQELPEKVALSDIKEDGSIISTQEKLLLPSVLPVQDNT